MAQHVDRPLRLGEVIAETVRLYGERIWPALTLGFLYTTVLVVGGLIHPVVYFAFAAFAFGLTFAAAARLTSGDSFTEAWGQVALRVPVLLVLSIAVALPFLVAAAYLVLIVLGVAWLAFASFAIPVAVLERGPGDGTWFSRLGFALERAVGLARAEYLHALGVAAALVLINFLLGFLLAGLLRGFADNGGFVAGVIAQVVLAPFFFLGLSVLYFDQRARVQARPAR